MNDTHNRRTGLAFDLSFAIWWAVEEAGVPNRVVTENFEAILNLADVLADAAASQVA
jgi:hypothetical protein